MSLKQRKISFEPRIKLNHNINTTPYFSAIKIFYCTLEERILPFVSSRRIKLHSKEMPHEYFYPFAFSSCRTCLKDCHSLWVWVPIVTRMKWRHPWEAPRWQPAPSLSSLSMITMATRVSKSNFPLQLNENKLSDQSNFMYISRRTN